MPSIWVIQEGDITAKAGGSGRTGLFCEKRGQGAGPKDGHLFASTLAT